MFRDYWDHFYAEAHPDLREPSQFARFCIGRITPRSTLFELGCGNGRDALFFARNGMAVTACDQSSTAIEELSVVASETDGWVVQPRFLRSRFEDLPDLGPVDVVYSRFTLHAISSDIASGALRWSWRNLRDDGTLFAEARTVNGDLYGVGEPAGRDAYIQDGHFRRFIRANELADELSRIGFRIDQLVEGTGLAVHGTDDPMVVRIVASRRSSP